jgi:hypothetical protein
LAALDTATAKEIAAGAQADHRAARLQEACDVALADSQRSKRREMLVRQQIVGLTERADRLDREVQFLDSERDVLARERDALKAALTKAERRTGYAVLPYKGPNGTWQRPIVLDCMAEGVRLQRQARMFTPLDLSPLIHRRSSPFVQAIARELSHIRVADTPDGAPAVPYLVFLVRPDGIRRYYEARTCLEPLGIAFGYELIAQNLAVNVPDYDDLSTWDGTIPLDLPLESAPRNPSTIASLSSAEGRPGPASPSIYGGGRPVQASPGAGGGTFGTGVRPPGSDTAAPDESSPEDFVWPGRGRDAAGDHRADSRGASFRGNDAPFGGSGPGQPAPIANEGSDGLEAGGLSLKPAGSQEHSSNGAGETGGWGAKAPPLSGAQKQSSSGTDQTRALGAKAPPLSGAQEQSSSGAEETKGWWAKAHPTAGAPDRSSDRIDGTRRRAAEAHPIAGAQERSPGGADAIGGGSAGAIEPSGGGPGGGGSGGGAPSSPGSGLFARSASLAGTGSGTGAAAGLDPLPDLEPAGESGAIVARQPPPDGSPREAPAGGLGGADQSQPPGETGSSAGSQLPTWEQVSAGSSSNSSGLATSSSTSAGTANASSSMSGISLGSASSASSRASSSGLSWGQDSASSSGGSDEVNFPPRPRPVAPMGSIEVPFEIVVVCRRYDVLLHPGAYRVTLQAMNDEGGGEDGLLAREIRAMVRRRVAVDPLIRPKPSIRFLVESYGAATFWTARRQLLFTLPDWPMSLQVSSSQESRVLNMETW